jgi:hypothetical protein
LKSENRKLLTEPESHIKTEEQNKYLSFHFATDFQHILQQEPKLDSMVTEETMVSAAAIVTFKNTRLFSIIKHDCNV